MIPFPKCAGKDSVFQIYRFKNLPAKDVPFSCERQAYPLHFFNVFKMCQHRVNAVLIYYHWSIFYVINFQQKAARSVCRLD